jgi:hypothetical protein
MREGANSGCEAASSYVVRIIGKVEVGLAGSEGSSGKMLRITGCSCFLVYSSFAARSTYT